MPFKPPERDYSDWFGQYVIAMDPIRVPGWNTSAVNGWHLSTHPDLPVIPVTVGDSEAGALLGWPCSNRLIEQLKVPSGEDPIEAVYTLGGRWLYIGRSDVYLDPMGTQPAVYSTDLRAVASSPGLLPAQDDTALIEAFDVRIRGTYFMADLTPKVGVRRLLPNHALSLESFETRRIHGAPTTSSDLTYTASLANDAAYATTRALAERYGLRMGLTAGRDSRTVLAALRPLIGAALNPDHFTLYSNENRGLDNTADLTIAPLIAHYVGLPLDIVPLQDTPAAELDAWQERAGGTVAGAVWRNAHANARQLDRVKLTSFAGEIARGRYWRPDDHISTPISSERLLRHVGAPVLPRTLSAVDKWRAGLPAGITSLHLLDLFYVEVSMGCWGAAQLLGPRRMAPIVVPHNRRDVIDAMMALPVEVKRASAFAPEAIQQVWPELLQWPFNKPIGWPAMKQRLLWLPRKARFHLGALRRQLMPS